MVATTSQSAPIRMQRSSGATTLPSSALRAPGPGPKAGRPHRRR